MVVPGTTPTTPQQKMQARVETTICREADIAIWFTDQALASARKRNPELGERGHMMLPGVDAPPFALEPYRLGEKFVIGHFGSLSETRNLASTIAALDFLVDQQPEMNGRIELHVYGGPLDPISALAVATARHSTVRHFGRIEADPVSGKSGREQILQRMRSADVLLLLHGVEPICAEYIPSKMYEYLWMQRPILALVHQNPQMAELVRGMGHLAIDTAPEYSDTADMASATSTALQRLTKQWSRGALPDNGTPSPYTTRASAVQLLAWGGAC
jgi:glycosyltransferase involved in cell wall biosynthesis